ncbi:MAG: pyridoxal-dependent decarboxylase [Actinomycetes bacterium]
MFSKSEESKELQERIFSYARERIAMSPPPLDSAKTLDWLKSNVPPTITDEGLGGSEALDLFENVLALACISTDHPGYLSFIPTSPTDSSTLFDLVVSASSIYGGSWLEGAGAVYAENQVLSWLATEVGLPESSGGVFVQGGSLGNLSALVTARYSAQQKLLATGTKIPSRWRIICSEEAHSSLSAAARVMDIDLIKAKVDAEGRLRGAAVTDALMGVEPDSVFAIVATAGTTNFGIVDNLEEVGKVANNLGIWFHIDGAYGLAGILAKSSRHLFNGSNRADSFIVDPHKWLFAPFDACALVYRDPNLARDAHAQHGEYLDTLTDSGEFNPSDYAFNLTRRVRGLPLWFSLATHGVDKYREAIEMNIQVVSQIADVIRRDPELELIREPELSVVVFKKRGWKLAEYEAWSKMLLDRGQAFVVPSSHRGEVNTRFAVVNPETTISHLEAIVESMKEL